MWLSQNEAKTVCEKANSLDEECTRLRSNLCG